MEMGTCFLLCQTLGVSTVDSRAETQNTLSAELTSRVAPLFFFSSSCPPVSLSLEINLYDSGSPRLPLVASELMDFSGGHCSHATVQQLLPPRVVCLAVFVQHVATPPGFGAVGAALFTLRPHGRLYCLAGEKKYILWLPPYLLPLMREPALSSTRSHRGCARFHQRDG